MNKLLQGIFFSINYKYSLDKNEDIKTLLDNFNTDSSSKKLKK